MKSRWVDIGTILGGTKVPVRVAFVINEAVKEAVRVGDIGERNKWQLIEYLAAEYLSGREIQR